MTGTQLNSDTATQAPSVQAGEGSLTRRASLSFANRSLSQAARFIVGFVVTPIIIRGLGAELYGAWMMIRQAADYLGLSDLRPMGTLKFTLGARQHVEDVLEKRRQIGAAILLWACTFPLLLSLGAGVVWATPFIIRTATEYTWAIRVAMALAVAGVASERILSLPWTVLRGMNLDYKAMGLKAATVLLGGFLTVLAIWGGWGLPGVAAATIAGIVIAGGVHFLVARSVLPWFGVARPTRKEFFGFSRLSGWLFISALSSLMLHSSDLLLIGIILGPSAAAIYFTTGAVLRLLLGPMVQLIRSGAPGITGLCGQRDWPRVEKVRTEMHMFAIGIMTVVGVGVLALNEPFLGLWVGDGFYGGYLTNLLLVLIAFQMVLFRVDDVIVEGMLAFREKAFAEFACGLFTLVAGGLMAYNWGLAGMAMGVFLGRVGLLVYLPVLISRRTGRPIKEHLQSMVRPVAVACLLLPGAYLLSPMLHPQTWLSLAVTASLLGCATAGVMWGIGLGKDARTVLSRRLVALVSAARAGAVARI